MKTFALIIAGLFAVLVALVLCVPFADAFPAVPAEKQVALAGGSGGCALQCIWNGTTPCVRKIPCTPETAEEVCVQTGKMDHDLRCDDNKHPLECIGEKFKGTCDIVTGPGNICANGSILNNTCGTDEFCAGSGNGGTCGSVTLCEDHPAE